MMLDETLTVQKKTQDSLSRVRALATEARDIGKETAVELERQTEQMVHIGEGVAQVDSEIDRAKRKLHTMAKRVATDKVILCFTLLLVGAIIGAIVAHF